MSQTPESLERLMADASQACGCSLARLGDANDPSWRLDAGDTGSVTAQWDEASRRLVLETEIGELPSDRYRAALEEALSFSLIWRQTRGARATVAPGSRTLRLLVDLHAEDLVTLAVANITAGLLEMAREWRTSWESPPEAPDEASHDSPNPGFVPV